MSRSIEMNINMIKAALILEYLLEEDEEIVDDDFEYYWETELAPVAEISKDDMKLFAKRVWVLAKEDSMEEEVI